MLFIQVEGDTSLVSDVLIGLVMASSITPRPDQPETATERKDEVIFVPALTPAPRRKPPTLPAAPRQKPAKTKAPKIGKPDEAPSMLGMIRASLADGPKTPAEICDFISNRYGVNISDLQTIHQNTWLLRKRNEIRKRDADLRFELAPAPAKR
jgi:hypothetical protein